MQYDETICSACHYAVYGCFGHRAAPLGVSDGPGSGNGKTNFNTPKPYEETLKAARVLEEKGKLTPERERFFKSKLKKLESKKGGDGTDYQKTGLPF